MKLLEDKTRVGAPSAEYPFGSLINETGSNNGTLVDTAFMNDMVQLMEKMFNESGITANGLPDNATNGFQLWESLVHAIQNQQKQKRYYINLFQTGTSDPAIQFVFEDDLGLAAPTLARTTTGTYTLTFASAIFPSAGKVIRTVENVGNSTSVGFAYVSVTSSTVLTIYTFDETNTLSDSLLFTSFLKLDIYP